MRRVLKWVKRIVLGTLAIVVVAVVALLIVLHTDWGRDKARTIALAQLQAIFPGGIAVERIEGSVLGDVTLVGVTINGRDGKRMIRAGRVTTNLELTALFGKTIALEFVRAEDVEVTDPSNPVELEEDPEPGTWTVELPQIAVRGARFTISGEQPMTFERLELDAALSVPPLDPLTARVQLRGHWKERGVPFTVEAEASVGEQVRVPKLVATLADARVEGTDLVVDLARPTGKLAIHATPAVVASFAPALALPAAADVTLALGLAGAESRIDLAATMGGASLTGAFLATPADQRIRGMLTASGIDVQTFVPRLTGSGDGTVAVVGDGKARTGHVLALVRGRLLDLPAGHALVDIGVDPEGARAMLVAGGSGEVGTAAIGWLARDGRRFDLVDARVVATARDAAAATGGQAPFKGTIIARGRARGSIAPALGIELDGQVHGYGLVSTDPKLGGLRIATLTGRADAMISEAGTFSHLHAILKDVRRAGAPLGTFELDARNRPDGKIAAKLQAHPALIRGSTADVEATVSLPKRETDPLVIALGDHALRAPRLAWTGSGGTITVTDAGVEVRGVRSRSGRASVAIDARTVSASNTLAVRLAARDVAAALVDPGYTGTISADVDLKRRGLRWDGKASIAAHGVALAGDLPAIEGTVALAVANRRVTADVTASTFEVGGVRLVLDVDGPRDLTDPRGWRRLERTAIRTAMLGLTRIDLAAAKVSTGGIVEGELVLSRTDASGSFAIAAVRTPAGTVAGDVNFASLGDAIGVSSTLHVEDLGDVSLAAQLAVPRHPFEPAEWKRLGRGVVRLLTANVEDVALDPAKLARLGIVTPYSARASLGLALAAGTGEVRANVELRDIRGGVLRAPVDVRVEAVVDPADTRAHVEVGSGKQTLTTVTARLPAFGFERWLADPKRAATLPFEGKLELPDVDVPAALALIGRPDITSGTLAGGIAFAGTPAKPTADANLVVSNVNIKPRLAGRKLPTLTELRVTGKWDGTTGNVAITGKESDGATLDITAHARPDDLAALGAKIDIRKFDIAPIAVFLPGPLVAATGKIGAKITVTGLSPDKIRGTLAVEKARVPIHPQVGTIRDANLSVKLNELGLAYNLTAKLGAGTIKLKGTAPKDLSKITIDGAVDKISPIGEIQPRIAATLGGTIFRRHGEVHAEIAVSKASVDLDLEQGVELLDAEMPEDLFIGRKTAPPPTPARQPRKPWVTVKATLDSTPVFVKHEYVQVRARANAKRGITLALGRTLGLDGSIEIERGDVAILGRQYRVDPGPDKIRFDGTLDPLLAIRLTHDFPTLSLTAVLGGRVSKKEVRMIGSPDLYTQEELLAFFLGADPGGDAGSTTRDVASSVGAAIVSAKLGRQAKKVLPFKVDVVACDPGTSASGSSCRLGRWLTENWYFQFKQRIEPRPDEPPQEVQLQYYFRKNWVLEGAGFLERFGGDVLWRKRW